MADSTWRTFASTIASFSALPRCDARRSLAARALLTLPRADAQYPLRWVRRPWHIPSGTVLGLGRRMTSEEIEHAVRAMFNRVSQPAVRPLYV
jgi:hypothetical protein